MSIFFNAFYKVFGFLTGLAIFLFFFGFIINYMNSSDKKSNFTFYKGNSNSTNSIAILNLNGPIISDPNEINKFNSLTNANAIYPLVIQNYLEELKDKNLKGLIISINSPGGSVAASSRIYDLFNKFKKKNDIPIYFYSNNILASGAYWISLSGNKIFASYGALVGSIGVKGPDWLYYNKPTSLSSGLFGNSVVSENGIKLFSNTAGKSKDILNPFREPTNKEKIQLQNMVNNIYEDFISLVSKNRKIEKNVIKDDIGAMIYDTKQAKNNFLIDEIKNIDQVTELMIKNLKINDYKLLKNVKKSFFDFQNLNSESILFFIGNDNFFNYEQKIIKEEFCNNIRNELSVVAINQYLSSC